MRFQPGQSGNPGGRKRTLASAVQQRYGKTGAPLVSLLADLAEGKMVADGQPMRVEAKDRIAAIKLLMSYGYGLPTQVLDVQTTTPATLRVVLDGDGPHARPPSGSESGLP